MNGPLSMYNLKPVVEFADAIDISPTMYKMKNIYSSSYNSLTPESNGDRCASSVLEQKPIGIEELEKRQEGILNQLNYLKQQMAALREELAKQNAVNGNTKHSSVSYFQNVKTSISWSGVTDEVVLHASLECPPYSLLAVSKLWPGLRLRVTCHNHSSVATVPEHLNVFNTLSSAEPATFHVRLIWKQMGPDCELVISPLSHTPIRGEVNFLRFLHRSLNSSAVVDLVAETQLDSVLDLCHRLSHARTQRDRQLAVRALNGKLGKGEWLSGNALSVADVAAWSILRSNTGTELSQNLNKWRSRCAAAIAQEVA